MLMSYIVILGIVVGVVGLANTAVVGQEQEHVFPLGDCA
jgi:regulator of protease activity HflC (stomatin/prohibitin superfamily)